MLIDSLNADCKRALFLEGASNATFAQKLFTLIFAYGLHALIVHRVGRYIKRIRAHRWLWLFYYPCAAIHNCFKFAVESMYDIVIDTRATIGEGFYIGHFGGIKIGACTIGKNCSIHQQVSIGTFPEGNHGIVQIGDDVWIGGHSAISRGVNIGNSATIVVGSKVISEVKPATMVMGNPARVIKQNFDNSALMGY